MVVARHQNVLHRFFPGLLILNANQNRMMHVMLEERLQLIRNRRRKREHLQLLAHPSRKRVDIIQETVFQSHVHTLIPQPSYIDVLVHVDTHCRRSGLTENEYPVTLVVEEIHDVAEILEQRHLKTGIGRLSAYCGAVSAGCGAGAGIAWLQGGRLREIAHTVVNAVAVTSGIVCDGAKASCAAKIAAAVDAGLLGLSMFRDGNQFYGGDGIVKKGVENTIANVGRLARDGMRETDREILRLMLES